jgi:hypothetical protein
MVKCRECGLVGVRHDDRTLREVDERCRSTGEAPQCCILPFLCSAQRATFSAPPADFLEQIGLDRECERFAQWYAGFTPKEHMEMMHADELHKMQEAQQQTQREQDRRWRNQDKWFNAILALAAVILGWVLRGGQLDYRPQSPNPPAATAPAPVQQSPAVKE